MRGPGSEIGQFASFIERFDQCLRPQIASCRSSLLPSLLFKINQNQLAFEAAIMELTLWIEQRGASEAGSNVRGALDTITKNEEFINMTLAVLMTPE